MDIREDAPGVLTSMRCQRQQPVPRIVLVVGDPAVQKIGINQKQQHVPGDVGEQKQQVSLLFTGKGTSGGAALSKIRRVSEFLNKLTIKHVRVFEQANNKTLLF